MVANITTFQNGVVAGDRIGEQWLNECYDEVESKIDVPTTGTTFPSTPTALGQHYIITEYPIHFQKITAVVTYANAAKDTGVSGLAFKSDGTRYYIVGTSSDSIHEYTVSTPYDLNSTVTFIQTLSLAAKETTITGLAFKTDGLKFYIVGTVSDQVHEYTMSSAWNISTATFTQSYSPSLGNIDHIAFSTDGLKMFVGVGASIQTYTLGTAWNISTASAGTSYALGLGTILGFSFSTTGDKLYLISSTTCYEYDLTTAYDLSTRRYANWTYGVGVTAKSLLIINGNMYIAEAGNTRYRTITSTKNVLIATGTSSVADWSRITPILGPTS